MESCPRRAFVQAGLIGMAAALNRWSTPAFAQEKPERQAEKRPRTKFLLACMTLPYSQFPLDRALAGIKSAGYRFVAWGTTHRENGGKPVPVLGPDDSPEKARVLAARCRDLGLEPIMMFTGIYPEAPEAVPVLTRRIEQAAAAKIPQILTFGHTQGANRELWIQRFKELAPIAQDQGVMIVVKQHGGETGTGKACAEITREVNHPSVKVNYDAGNVMDYLNVDPIPDIQECAADIHSLCIKDHRNFPRDEDCGPGLGEIDHYRLLSAVSHLGRDMPLCCENIFAPLLSRPSSPEGVDQLARRAREFLELVVAGLAT